MPGKFQEMVGEVEGERRLADAERPRKQQRVRQLAGAIGRGQHRGRRAVAEEMQGSPPARECRRACHAARERCVRTSAPPALLPGRHATALREPRRPRPSPHFRPPRHPPRRRSRCSVSALSALCPEKPGGGACGRRASPSRSGRPGPSPRRSDARRRPSSGSMSKISVMSGMTPLTRYTLDLVQKRGIDGAGGALVDARRIDEAVAKHDLAAPERRADHLLDMVGARGGKQQRLHLRAERLGSAGKDHVADRFRARRSARLARHHHGVALVAQLLRQPPDLRRLARPFPAFERDEKAARQIRLSMPPIDAGRA